MKLEMSTPSAREPEQLPRTGAPLKGDFALVRGHDGRRVLQVRIVGSCLGSVELGRRGAQCETGASGTVGSLYTVATVGALKRLTKMFLEPNFLDLRSQPGRTAANAHRLGE